MELNDKVELEHYLFHTFQNLENVEIKNNFQRIYTNWQ